jgi:hypothetical protein
VFVLLRTLSTPLRPYRWQVSVVGMALLIDSAFFHVWPLSVTYVVEDAIQPRNHQVLLLIRGVVAGGGVVATVAQRLRGDLYARMASNLLNDVRLQRMAHSRSSGSCRMAIIAVQWPCCGMGRGRPRSGRVRRACCCHSDEGNVCV